MRWAVRVARLVEMSNAYRTLVVNTEGKRPHETPQMGSINVKTNLINFSFMA